MAEIKWIKLSVNMFDDEKIKLIRKMPEGTNILLVWIYLLTLAGKTNASGYIFLAENIPYSDEMLASVMDMPLNVVRIALKTFIQFGMLEADENNYLLISNWEKHQNIDGMDKIREQNKLRKQKQREREKALITPVKEELGIAEESNVTSRDSHAIEEEREEDKDIDKDIEEEKELPVPYEKIKDLYNNICSSLSKIKSLSRTRKQHLKARWSQFKYNIQTFEEVFTKLENSEFCKGNNDRGWKADFDWLIKNDINMLKVLEGKYDNKDNPRGPNPPANIRKTGFHNFEQRTAKYTNEELEEIVRKKRFGQGG